MSGFVDIYPACALFGYPTAVWRRRKTKIVTVANGSSTREQIWSQSKSIVQIPKAVRKYDDMYDLIELFEVMDGPACTWPVRDPVDYATVRSPNPITPPAISPVDMPMELVPGTTATYQLVKTYSRTYGPLTRTHSRYIWLPVVDSVRVAVDGVEVLNTSSPAAWEVTREGGRVTFASPLAEGQVPTWGGLFDLHVRFEADDSLAAIVQSWNVNGFADLTLIEEPICTDDE